MTTFVHLEVGVQQIVVPALPLLQRLEQEITVLNLEKQLLVLYTLLLPQKVRDLPKAEGVHKVRLLPSLGVHQNNYVGDGETVTGEVGGMIHIEGLEEGVQNLLRILSSGWKLSGVDAVVIRAVDGDAFLLKPAVVHEAEVFRLLLHLINPIGECATLQNRFLRFLQLLHALGNELDVLAGPLPNPLQAAAQLLQLFAGGPACQIGKAVIGGVEPQRRANHKGNRLCLCLPDPPVQLDRLAVLGVVMELGVGNLVNKCLDGLKLADARANNNPLLRAAHVAHCRFALHCLKGDGQRRQLHQHALEIFKAVHAPLQGTVVDGGQGLAVRLGHVEDPTRGEEGYTGHSNLDRLAVFVQNRIAVFIRLHILPHPLSRRSQNNNAFLALANLTVEFFLPRLIPGDQRSIRTLEVNQDDVVDGIIVELGHNGQHLLVAFALKHRFGSVHHLLHDAVQLLFLVRLFFLGGSIVNPPRHTLPPPSLPPLRPD